MVNWNDPVNTDRLLAAVIGAAEGKINNGVIARLFGQGATYHTIESHLRGVRRLAKQLVDEAATGAAGDTATGSASGSTSAAAPALTTPKKGGANRTIDLNNLTILMGIFAEVKSSRVTKSKSPKKAAMKAEEIEGEMDEQMEV
ncbi:hypothetical protein K432DRAFT_392716 [Lepidopterella palustris CBS 459.81]|uniref:Uncharacterized protein n=1 Tax=Lepidopterella palustris CBS 459.81 TaxID=1314670 RepID=A0A8E2EB90_9PEZI|nr:hypothetical protein K432DRAFT_392716 [Lepidopterella palustris CBS 459.81]